MVQPNAYWTLLTPYVTIIGLYTNVPEGGRLDQDQIDWLAQELAEAPAGIGLAVATHHPIYSADAHHGGSAYMGTILDNSIRASGRRPDVVLTAHVHNYQRFTRTLGEKPLTYLVAGAGGYWHLHYMAVDENGQSLQVPWQVPGLEVTLDNYVEDRHGYLRVTATARELAFEYVTVPRPQESWRHGPVTVADSFSIAVPST
jgi:3',5'-cyclic AMP phosphodiesterase CpdA